MILNYKGLELEINDLDHVVPNTFLPYNKTTGSFLIYRDQLYWSSREESSTAPDKFCLKIQDFSGPILVHSSYYLPADINRRKFQSVFSSTSFLYLYFIDGKLTERRIGKKFIDYTLPISFGKYKGLPYDKLLYRYVPRVINYLENLFKVLLNKNSDKMLIPADALELKKEIDLRLQYFFEIPFGPLDDSALTIKDFKIIIGKDSFLIYYQSLDDDFGEVIDDFVKILESDFTNLINITPISETGEKSFLDSIYPEFAYLYWAIDNVENFCILPSYFDESHKLFERFKVHKVKNNLYDYHAVYASYKTLDKLDSHIMNKNYDKFCAIENVKYNSGLQFYEIDNTIMNEYLRFWIHDREQNLFYEENSSDDSDLYDTQKYYSNPWLASLPPDEASEAYSNTD